MSCAAAHTRAASSYTGRRTAGGAPVAVIASRSRRKRMTSAAGGGAAGCCCCFCCWWPVRVEHSGRACGGLEGCVGARSTMLAAPTLLCVACTNVQIAGSSACLVEVARRPRPLPLLRLPQPLTPPPLPPQRQRLPGLRVPAHADRATPPSLPAASAAACQPPSWAAGLAWLLLLGSLCAGLAGCLLAWRGAAAARAFACWRVSMPCVLNAAAAAAEALSRLPRRRMDVSGDHLVISEAVRRHRQPAALPRPPDNAQSRCLPSWRPCRALRCWQGCLSRMQCCSGWWQPCALSCGGSGQDCPARHAGRC